MSLPPIPAKFTSVIAQRDIVFVTQWKRQRIRIRIGQPVRDVPTAGGLDWRCPVSMTGMPRIRALRGIGVDSMQALVHALKLIEIEIGARERKEGGRFEWLGWPSHGLPVINLRASTFLRRPNKALQPTSRARKHAKAPKRSRAARG
jgi:hypothetical protein